MTDTPLAPDGYKAVAVDLSPWRHDGFAVYPLIDLDSFSVAFTRPRDEQTNRRGKVVEPARPVLARVNGPIGGTRVFVDSDRLRAEARRLVDAADALDHLQAFYPPARSTLDIP